MASGTKRLFLQVSTPFFVSRLKTRKSQDQWDRYLNGVEDNATREGGRECGTYSRGKGLKIVGSSA